MKRPRLFLGITTVLLSIVGVAAAKHFGHSRTAFYCSLGSRCISISTVCTSSGFNQCTYAFTTVTNGDITTHNQNVYMSGVNGGLCATCTMPIKYATEHF